MLGMDHRRRVPVSCSSEPCGLLARRDLVDAYECVFQSFAVDEFSECLVDC